MIFLITYLLNFASLFTQGYPSDFSLTVIRMYLFQSEIIIITSLPIIYLSHFRPNYSKYRGVLIAFKRKLYRNSPPLARESLCESLAAYQSPQCNSPSLYPDLSFNRLRRFSIRLDFSQRHQLFLPDGRSLARSNARWKSRSLLSDIASTS